MSRHVEEIQVQPDGRDGTVSTHPAFAQISASRVTGGAVLYGSDFQHQHFVTIKIKQSQSHRSLSRDWHNAGEEYIEVALSEAQWAAFVSSMNVGSGTTCTLTRRNREMIPSLPDPVSRRDQFNGEVSETLRDAIKALDKLTDDIDALKLSEKQKGELRGRVETARREIGSNVPFVLKQFGEHVEHTVEKAKVQINAYATATVMRAGIAALNGHELHAIEYRDGSKREALIAGEVPDSERKA